MSEQHPNKNMNKMHYIEEQNLFFLLLMYWFQLQLAIAISHLLYVYCNHPTVTALYFLFKEVKILLRSKHLSLLIIIISK